MLFGSLGLRQKMTLAMAGFVTVTGFMVAGFDFVLSAQNVTEISHQQFDTVGKLYGGHMSTWFASKTKVLESFPAEIDPAQLQRHLLFTRNAGAFDNVFLAYPDGRQDNANNVHLPPDNNDPRKWNWFKRANDTPEKSFVDMPSVAAATGQAVSSMAKALVQNGKLVGVLGADMQIATILNELQYTSVIGDGYMFITNREGKIFAHSDKKLLGHPASELGDGLTSEALQTMAGQHQFVTMDVGGESSIVASYPIAHSDYQLVMVAKRAVLFAPLYHKLWITLAVMALVLLLVILASRWYVAKQLSGLLQVRDAMLEISQGEADLTSRILIDEHDEVGQTAEAFNQFVAHLGTTFTDLRANALTLTQGVVEVNRLVEKLSEDSHRLSDISGSNAASIEQITVSVSNIAATAEETDELAKSTGSASGRSAADMQNISEKMQLTSTSVNELGGLLDSLEKRSQEITTITNVIHDIADQTNLLALNAAIEAARAGEQGRGFAVVADEVRKLAERTGNATIEISRMIENILQEITGANANMQGTMGMVASGVELTQSAREQLSAIQQSMSAMLDKISSIARATGEQRQATSTMASSTETINGQILKSDADMKSAREVLASLNTVANDIQSSFNRFKL
jgi:methyl-accepting chemotaxis protein